MRRIFAALAILLVGTHLAFGADRQPQVRDGSDHPKDGFVSADALSKWAGTSSFGGGFVQSARLGDQLVYVVMRSFTSGTPSTELSVYAPKMNSRGLYRVLLQPSRMVQLHTRFTADSIIIEQYDRVTRNWVVSLTITKQFFQDEATYLKQ